MAYKYLEGATVIEMNLFFNVISKGAAKFAQEFLLG